MGDDDEAAQAERERKHIEKVFNETVSPTDDNDNAGTVC